MLYELFYIDYWFVLMSIGASSMGYQSRYPKWPTSVSINQRWPPTEFNMLFSKNTLFMGFIGYFGKIDAVFKSY